MHSYGGLEWEETVDEENVATVKWSVDQTMNIIAAVRTERLAWLIAMAESEMTGLDN